MYRYRYYGYGYVHFYPIRFLQSSIFRLERERDVKRGQGPVNATDPLRAPLCVFLSFGRAFGSAVLPVPGTHVVALEPYKL